MKGTSTVGSVVDGAMPKRMMEKIPRRTVTITLRWSLMIDFKHSQNYKEKKHNEIKRSGLEDGHKINMKVPLRDYLSNKCAQTN